VIDGNGVAPLEFWAEKLMAMEFACNRRLDPFRKLAALITPATRFAGGCAVLQTAPVIPAPRSDSMKLMLMRCLVVGVAGFVGAITRYLVNLGFARSTINFPLGTFIINVTGCLILGWFITYARAHNITGSLWFLAIGVGFVGAYTTFSTFIFESNQRAQEGAWNIVTAYVLASVFVGSLACWLGQAIARWM
jgi:CrcB protein